MKLFEIKILAYKRFYLEAESHEEALMSDLVGDEQSVSGGEQDWEHDETTADEIEEPRAKHIRQNYPHTIVKQED